MEGIDKMRNKKYLSLFMVSALVVSIMMSGCGKSGNVNKNSKAEEYDALEESDKDDLVINGEGTLSISGKYNHGIQGKDNLKIISGNIVLDTVGDGNVGMGNMRPGGMRK